MINGIYIYSRPPHTFHPCYWDDSCGYNKHPMKSSLYSSNSQQKQKATNGTSNEMEEQMYRENEELLDALGNNVARMKGMAGVLHREAADQNDLLKQLQEQLNSARSGVGTSIRQMQGVFNRYGSSHTVFLALAFFLILVLFYYVSA
ncbi:blocked early in transport 1 [Strigomonas culicis]|uniref:Blocked early in transport 1 n=1 Tax=Strigomonas culicis TaxID=28005 RepID=S9V8A4_9TRYP|nr:blocked early in transport 1 [Strigomonas culicis]|eukprot:EPY37038.1 blocked early in transport 1 [Strigomonas culicis]